MSVALAGNPNCGKTALFNALTGSRQKVGNYPGVTVERKEGTVTTPSGQTVRILDLPGTYSLDARTPDEMIARDVLLGKIDGETQPTTIIAVADATNLERNLGLVLELRALGKPVVLAVNMMDLAKSRGMELDCVALSRELGVPVVQTVATKGRGIQELLAQVETGLKLAPVTLAASNAPEWVKSTPDQVRARFAEVDRILSLAITRQSRPAIWTDRLDRVVLHPVWGSLVLVTVLALIFQAVFSWASVPADLIEGAVASFGEWVSGVLPEGPVRSLVVDGAIAGVGSVVVFIPQILLLYFFILLLEDSGYMARAAFLMDRLMGRVGLHGRAFIPLLSSYACAIPGIMATRAIENRRDRLTTILIAPLTTCSARLPVYTLLISAFIPKEPLLGPIGHVFGMQGAVMFALYFGGIVMALAMAMVFRLTMFKGPKPSLLLEMPTYKWPSWRNITLGLYERARLFLRRAGTVILALSVVVWFLASYPKAPEGSAEPAIYHSYAGTIGRAIAPALEPLGFNWQISVALIPGFAAREVMVSALGTVYALEGDEEQVGEALGSKLSKEWSLATALSLMVWYIIALQCLSTIAVARRETNSWRWPALMIGYMTALAYFSSFVTYNLARWAGWG